MKKLFNYLVVFLEVLLVISLLRGLIKTMNSRKRIDELLEKKNNLAGQKVKLEGELEAVGGEFYLEKVARDELHLVKEGEAVVILDEEEGVMEEKEGMEEREKKEVENWRKWLRVLFGER